MDQSTRHLRPLTETTGRGGNHVPATSPLLHASASELWCVGSRQAKPGSARPASAALASATLG